LLLSLSPDLWKACFLQTCSFMRVCYVVGLSTFGRRLLWGLAEFHLIGFIFVTFCGWNPWHRESLHFLWNNCRKIHRIFQLEKLSSRYFIILFILSVAWLASKNFCSISGWAWQIQALADFYFLIGLVILVLRLRYSYRLLFLFLLCCFGLWNFWAVLLVIFITVISFRFIDLWKFCKCFDFDLLIINYRMNVISCLVKMLCLCFLRCRLVGGLCDHMKSLTSCMEIQFLLLIIHLLNLLVSHLFLIYCWCLNVLSIILDLFKYVFHYWIKNL